MRQMLIFLMTFYKKTMSPLLRPVLGSGCRFTPTCSEYAIEALKKYGTLKGSWLATRRFLKCHPFTKSGFDPVPEHIN